MPACHDSLCTARPRWRLTDAERPGLVLFACRTHLLPLVTASRSHVLSQLPEVQPA